MAGAIPWQVAIFTDPADVYNTQNCGGALISDSFVLTAAHCYDPAVPRPYVGVGFAHLDNSASGQVIQASQWITHPDFDSDLFDNDIALLQLSTPVDLTACGTRCGTIAYATLETESESAPLGAAALVSGWGKLVGGLNPPNVYPRQLQSASLNLVDCVAAPSQWNSTRFTENMLCASVPDFSRDSCQGDSGGPLVVDSTSTTPLVLGIVSFGNGCAVANFPGVYARVARYTDWIESSMASAAPDTPTEELQSGGAPAATEVAGNNAAPAVTQDSGGGGAFGSGTMGLFLLLTSLLRRRRG